MLTTPAITEFSIARLPRIEFGSGKLSLLPELISQYGKRTLIVTGANSFLASPAWETIKTGLKRQSISWEICRVSGEPSPDFVDETVSDFAGEHFDVVLGIGGGSALDAAKAIAGLLRVKRSVMDYLEGVGPELQYKGPVVPFIAVPTTAGTGSEATKNAVLSRQGKNGFKKSFRHELLVADYAVVDPDLLAMCPAEIIAANGMDALTQLLESYVSLRANPLTDALAINGLHAVHKGLLALYRSQGANSTARSLMAYASLLSGITLAQTGLGSVHGLASPLGAFYPIPHGVVCGTLVAAASEINIEALSKREPENPALEKYARLAEILTGRKIKNKAEALQTLVNILYDWTRQLNLPLLGCLGLDKSELGHVVAHSRGSSMKTNPIVLTDEEIKKILIRRL